MTVESADTAITTEVGIGSVVVAVEVASLNIKELHIFGYGQCTQLSANCNDLLRENIAHEMTTAGL